MDTVEIDITENLTTVEVSIQEGSIVTSGVGEVNTASNQGGGSELVLPKDVVDLPFRTLLGGSNIQINTGTDTLTIQATGLVTTFEGLSDVFTFSGESLKAVRVNLGETALEAYTPSAGGDFSDGGDVAGADRTLGNTDNYDLGFLTNNLNRLQIQNDGKIGIGIAVALAKLHINGTPGTLAEGLVFGDGDTGFYESADDTLDVSIAGTTITQFIAGRIQMVPAAGFGSAMLAEQASGTNPSIIPTIQDFDTGIGWNGSDQLSLIAGTKEALTFIEASNYVIQKHHTHSGITASTTQNQGQQSILSSYNEVSTVANGNDVVTLPTAVKGYKVTIINNGANTLQIFPASGDDLGAGVNTSTTLAAGSSITFFAYDVTNWEII